MAGIIALMFLAPAAVAAGLILFKSVTLTFVLFHGVVCLLVPLIDMALHRISLSQFLRNCGLRSDRGRLLSSLLWGLSAFAVVYLFFALFHRAIWDSTGISGVISSWGIQRMNPVIFFSMMVLGNAFLEEFFWRGYVVYKLSSRVRRRTVILLSAAFYASYHTITTGVLFSLSYAVVSTVSIFAAGVLWGTVRMKTGSLLFPVVTHLFVDLAVMAAYLSYLA